GVVNQDIDFAESRARFFKHRGDRCKVGHIALCRESFDAQLFHFARDLFRTPEAKVVDDYALRVVLREAKRDRASDTLSGARHQADASVEIEDVTAHVCSPKQSAISYSTI